MQRKKGEGWVSSIECNVIFNGICTVLSYDKGGKGPGNLENLCYVIYGCSLNKVLKFDSTRAQTFLLIFILN